MPIFQEPDRRQFHDSWSAEPGSDDEGSRPSRFMEDKQTDVEDTKMTGTSPADSSMENYSVSKVHTGDRDELIQRIKRGQSPTWVPNRSVSSPYCPVSHDELCPKSGTAESRIQDLLPAVTHMPLERMLVLQVRNVQIFVSVSNFRLKLHS